ncbi:MAG: DNA-binding protein [Ruminococcus sp.]|nr:DNA-binding protein [Ruminococcus sp.]
MAKDLQFVMLFDCYGEFLTERQRQVTEMYYGEDLSLSEISELSGITRQAVRDGIKRSEEILRDMESKLGFAERLSALRKNYAQIGAAVRAIAENAADSPKILERCSVVETKVQEGLKLL